jgi:hypothetical protein
MVNVEAVLLAVGILLIVASVTLIFLSRPAPAPTPLVMLFFGVVLCLTETRFKSFDIDLFRGHATIVKDQVPERTSDVAQAIAPLELSITELRKAMAKLQANNESLTSSVNALQTKVPIDHPQIASPDINKTSDAFRENNQYTIYVFYRTPRRQAAQSLVKGLTEAGFTASSIATSFKEAPQLAPDGSTWIVPTPTRGTKIADAVAKIALDQGLPNVEVDEPYQVSRGDVQVFLY